VGWEWLTGTGPQKREFEAGDPFTEMLKKHEHIQSVREEAIARLNKGERKFSKPLGKNYKLSGIQGIGKYIKDYSTLLTAGMTGNIAVTYLGSYKLEYSITDINETKGTATIHFSVTNASTIGSATRLPVLGYMKFWKNNMENKLNNIFSSGPMSIKKQEFKWSETIHFNPKR
jgi:hypothetical protein